MSATVASQSSPNAPAAADEALIPFLDLRAQYETIKEEVLDAIRATVENCSFILGPDVAAFEEAFAAHVGARHCIGVNSGTSALHLALIAAGVGPGDEVIVPAMTYVATAWAISYVGATPVFVDVDPVSRTIDVEQIERRITPRTRALLPVHLYGGTADMDRLLELGRRHGIPVVEDAAQAHGARHRGRGAGTMGLIGCFSFYPGKNLGAYGEAGALVTNDDAVARRVRRLRDHGQERRYHHDEIGYNYRMEGIQGAVLGVKLKRLEAWTEARRRLADRYLDALAGLPLELPSEAPNSRHVWHLFVVQHPQRDLIRLRLEEKRIQTHMHYPVPVHLQKAYAHLGHREGDFPISERIARECFTLPLYPELTDAAQDRVVEALREVLRGVDKS